MVRKRRAININSGYENVGVMDSDGDDIVIVVRVFVIVSSPASYDLYITKVRDKYVIIICDINAAADDDDDDDDDDRKLRLDATGDATDDDDDRKRRHEKATDFVALGP